MTPDTLHNLAEAAPSFVLGFVVGLGWQFTMWRVRKIVREEIAAALRHSRSQPASA